MKSKVFSKARTHRVVAGVVSVFLVGVVSALAFFLIYNVIGEGSTTTKVGTQEKITEHVAFGVELPELKAPGKPQQLSVFLARDAIHNPIEIHKLNVSFTNSNEPACSDSWFVLSHLSSHEKELFVTGLATNEVFTGKENGGNGEIFFSETGAEVELQENGLNESACEGTTLGVHVVSEA